MYQAALKALQYCATTSKAAMECRNISYGLAVKYTTSMMFVLNYRAITGYCEADELARVVTSFSDIDTAYVAGVSLAS